VQGLHYYNICKTARTATNYSTAYLNRAASIAPLFIKRFDVLLCCICCIAAPPVDQACCQGQQHLAVISVAAIAAPTAQTQAL
jgi:hypothetical protein